MRKILVLSGKGGVGKSTLTVALARAMKDCGHRVGVLDIDIDTPNIPEFMSIEKRDIELSDKGIVPKNVGGIEVMSIGLVAEPEYAVMWGGERRVMAISQMLNKVEWTCDILFIDSPPGTTEEVRAVIEHFNPDGLIIITTNHRASLSDVKRTLSMIKLLKSSNKIIGIIKNMTCIICECGKNMNLFEIDKNGDDREIDSRVISEIPYINEYSNKIEDYLNQVVEKIEEVVI